MEVQSISIIGAGNLATHLAKAFHASRITVRQIYSRRLDHAQDLASQVGATPEIHLDKIEPVDLIIICVTDSAIPEVYQSLKDFHSFMVHTSGSTPMEVCKDIPGYGVFYPFQTFSKTVDTNFASIPIFAEANDPLFLEALMHLGGKISHHVSFLSSESRLMLHLAAVFASNFSNHMYTLSKEIMDQAGLDFKLLGPLITETTKKALFSEDPRLVQTGPAVRGNFSILEKHEEILQDKPLWQKIYTFVSSSIQEEAKNCK